MRVRVRTLFTTFAFSGTLGFFLLADPTLWCMRMRTE
jgi:hypothetical protein